MLRITSLILLSLILSSCSFFSWLRNKSDEWGDHMPVSSSAKRCEGRSFCFGSQPEPSPDQGYTPQDPSMMTAPPPPAYPQQYQDPNMIPQGYNATSQSQIYNMQMPNYQQNPYYQGGSYPPAMPNNYGYGGSIQPTQPRY